MAPGARTTKPHPIWLAVVGGVLIALLFLVARLGSDRDRAADRTEDARAHGPEAPAVETPAKAVVESKVLAPPDDAAIDEALPASATAKRSSVLAGPIHGTIVDARTREPVPFVEVRLVSGLVEETLITPRDGTFRTTQEFAGEKLSAIVSDAGRALLTIQRAKGARAEDPWTLELATGPTYPLVIEESAGVDAKQWIARVVETTRNLENAGEIDVDDRGLRMSAPIVGAVDREWPWMALRTEAILAGDIPWIRYPAVKFEPDPRYRLRLQVRCETLGRKGLGRIRATVGAQEPVLVDGLMHVGALTGQIIGDGDAGTSGASSASSSSSASGVSGASGAKGASGATVMLLSREPLGDGDHTPQWEVTQTGEKGEFHFADLVPGRRTLLAFAPRAEPVLLPVTVDTGIKVLGESIQMPKGESPSKGSAAEAQSEARALRRGREQVLVHVRLPEAGRFARDWVRAVAADPLYSRTATLGSERLPASRLDLEWLDLFESRYSSSPAVTPTRMQIASPSETLNVSYGWRDGRELRFEIEGESERASIFELSFEPGGAMIGERSSPELDRWLFDRKSPMRWVAWRRGFAPVFGDERSFVASSKRERAQVAKIKFAPGWGAVLWCRATDGMPSTSLGKLGALGYAGDDAGTGTGLHAVLASPPLPGVRVLVDGTLAATSDAEGVVRLAQSRLPARLVLVADHWHMKLLEHLPQRGSATQRYVVWMERD
jgi:hypothetical protein